MKKLFLALAISIIFATTVFALSSSAAQITVDSKPIDIVAYNIKGNNYFKLREVAMLLSGTKAQFDVGWDANTSTILLTSGTAYTGTDSIVATPIVNPVARNIPVAIKKDGAKILLAAYNINGNNFFKLRDLAAAFNFGVTWDAATNTVGIDTNSEYVFPEATPGVMAINPYYISLSGLPATEVEKRLGEGTFVLSDPDKYVMMVRSGVATYEGDVQFHYGGLFGDNIDYKGLYPSHMTMPITKFFSNCPENVTVEQLKTFFLESYIPTDYYLREKYALVANYCGYNVYFVKNSETGIIDTVELSGGYSSYITEVVYVGQEWNNYIEKTLEKSYADFLHSFGEQFPFKNGSYPVGGLGVELIDFDGTGELDLLVISDSYWYDTEDTPRVYTKVGQEVVLLYECAPGENIVANYMTTEYGHDGIWTIMKHVDVQDGMGADYWTFRNGQKQFLMSARTHFDIDTYTETLYINNVISDSYRFLDSLGQEYYHTVDFLFGRYH